ncbi:sulfotransferase family 2 domain-containing protein [bacterium]|nr:sulfotransferase family 2 domain-containing protein [bacterium]
MLISHKNKFITIDIPKTGTRSMRLSLEPLGIIDITGGPYSTKHNPFEQHGSALSAKKQFIKKNWNWQEYYKWIIVRNPWERYFSFFKYFKSYGEKYSRRDESISWGQVQVNQGKMCVDLFRERSDIQVLRNIISNHKPQDSYYCQKNGEIIVDHIASFENLGNEFIFLCDKIGIQTSELQHGNKSANSLNIYDLYNQELIDLVADKEKRVIQLKGYEY